MIFSLEKQRGLNIFWYNFHHYRPDTFIVNTVVYNYQKPKKGIIKNSLSILLIIFICFSSYMLVDWIMSFSQHF